MAGELKMAFNDKAKSVFQNFDGFPKPSHPLWKGFPQLKWQKSLESMDWRNASSPREKEEIKVPFAMEDLHTLMFNGERVEWLKNESPDVQFRVNDAFAQPDILSGHLQDSFHGLSNKLASPGLELEIKEGVSLEKPLLCLLDVDTRNSWKNFSHQVRLGRGAKATILFFRANRVDDQSLSSHLVSANLGKASHLNFVQLGSLQHISHSYFRSFFRLGKESELEFIDMGYGVQFGRSEVFVGLEDRFANAKVSGLHLLKDEDVYDTRVRVKHLAPETQSYQNFKCVVADKAHSLFGGNIVIEKEAQKVDSSQSHKALLLSKAAKASAFPELEVNADDVKAAHGSSTGQMDADQVFYLKSRGLSEAEATHLLSEAFIKDVILKQSDPKVRSLLEEVLSQMLPQFIGQMESKWVRPQ